MEELLTGRGRLIRKPVDFSMDASGLTRSSSTEIENILDVSNIQELEAEDEEWHFPHKPRDHLQQVLFCKKATSPWPRHEQCRFFISIADILHIENISEGLL